MAWYRMVLILFIILATIALAATMVSLTLFSPYLFFWQASQEAEESRLSHRHKYRERLTPSENYFTYISTDTWIGMSVSVFIAFFIMVTTAATLNAHGVTRIETAAQAAETLRPIAGELTFMLFAAGIIGTGLLAVPVLAGSAVYAVAETFGLRGSLELPARHALGFYAIIGAATLTGAALAATDINPIAMLFWTAVINGVVAVPIMVAMMLVVSGPKRETTIFLPLWVKLLGWLGAGLMALAVVLLAWTSLF